MTIATSDKDMMQLVGDDVRMYNIRNDKWIDRQDVIDKFGVPPHQVRPPNSPYTYFTFALALTHTCSLHSRPHSHTHTYSHLFFILKLK